MGTNLSRQQGLLALRAICSLMRQACLPLPVSESEEKNLRLPVLLARCLSRTHWISKVDDQFMKGNSQILAERILIRPKGIIMLFWITFLIKELTCYRYAHLFIGISYISNCFKNTQQGVQLIALDAE